MINSFYDVVTNFYKEFKKRGLVELQDIFIREEQIFHEKINHHEWHVKGWKSRLVWTPLGDLKITRRIYEKYPRKGIQRILFDKHIGLDPFLYIQRSFFPLFISHINNASSYNSLSDIFGQNLSTTTISKIIKEQEVYLKPKNIRDKTPLLFVNLDDIYVKQHKGKKYAYRMAVAYTGSKSTGNKNRKELIDRTLLPINMSISIEKQAQRLEQILMEIYGKIGKVIIVGDGARWITSFKKYFAFTTTERYIDKFHYKKFIRDFVGRDNKINWDEFLKMKKDEMVHYILSMVADEHGVVEISRHRVKLLPKIKRWFNSFKVVTEKDYPNAIEGVQSQYVARSLKSRRAFSFETAKKIMIINIAKYNGWEITTEENYGYKLFEVYKQDVKIETVTREFSNLPLLSSNKVNMVSMLNEFAWPS